MLSAQCRRRAGEETPKAYGTILHGRDSASIAPPYEWTSQLPATHRGKQWGEEASGVNDLFKEIRPVFTG